MVRTSLQKQVGGYDPLLPHSGDLEMWMRLAAHADVGYVRGVDQAFYRIHGHNMTKSFSPLADLSQRRLAYETVLERCRDQLPDQAMLSELVHRKLSREALWSAARAYDRGRTAHIPVDELVAFAFECWPEANTLPAYRGLQLRRLIGPRRHALPAAIRPLRLHTQGRELVVAAVMETAGPLGVVTIDGSSWDGLVVLCAANSYDSVKVADQHIAEQLSRLTPVLYVDPPLSRLTPAKNPELAQALAGPRLRVLAPGLARLTPVVQPFPSRPGIASFTTALAARHIRRATSRLGGRVRALICAWPLYPVFGSGGEQVRVYWAQDDFVGGAALLGMNAKQLDARERRVAAAADLIIAANPVVADTWRGRGRDPVLIPYGADVAAYSGVDQAPLPLTSACAVPSPVSSARSTTEPI